MNPEEELFKALIGLDFQCSVCGKQHNPKKTDWHHCEFKMLKEFGGQYRLFEISVPFKYFFKKGQDVYKKEKLYRAKRVQLWRRPFELITITEKIREKLKRYNDWNEAVKKWFISELEKMPDKNNFIAQPHTYDGRMHIKDIILLDIEGKSPPTWFPISVLFSVFEPPHGERISGIKQGEGNDYAYFFINFTPDLKYAVMCETEISIKNLVITHTRFYLLRDDGAYVEINEEESRQEIEKLRNKYNF